MTEETQVNPDVEAAEDESTNEQSAQESAPEDAAPEEGRLSRVPPKDSEELKKWLEALLFAAGRYMTLGELKTLCAVEEQNLICEAIKELREEYASRLSPLTVIGDHDAWKITVVHDYLDIVEGIMPEMEFDRPLLETLAVVAWRQPILQSEVVKIRSSTAYEHIHDLLEKNFIKREKYGRSFVLKTTKQFSEYFELPGKEAVKKLFVGIEGELEKSMKRKEKSGDLTVYDAQEEGSGGDGDTEGESAESSEPRLEPYFGKPGEESESSDPSESESGEVEDGEGEAQDSESEQSDEESDMTESDMTESEEEKARRVIEELAADEPGEESEESGSESKGRELHPALENFAEKVPLSEQEETESPEPTDEKKEVEEPESSEESDAAEESSDEEPKK